MEWMVRPSPSPWPWPSPRPRTVVRLSPSRPRVKTEADGGNGGWTRPLDFGGRVQPGSEPNILLRVEPNPLQPPSKHQKTGSTRLGRTLPFNQTHGKTMVQSTVNEAEDIAQAQDKLEAQSTCSWSGIGRNVLRTK